MNKFYQGQSGGRFPIHPSVTDKRVMEATRSEMTSLENPGICLACGEDAMDCEPDAAHYECEVCGANAVFGAAEALMHGYYHDTGDNSPIAA